MWLDWHVSSEEKETYKWQDFEMWCLRSGVRVAMALKDDDFGFWLWVEK